MGFCIKLIVQTSQSVYEEMEIWAADADTMFIFCVVLLIIMTKLLLRGAPKLIRSRWRKQLVLWGVLIAYLLTGASDLIITEITSRISMFRLPGGELARFLATSLAKILKQVPAVLLLNFRPRRIANLTDSYCGRKMLSSAKVISAVWLIYDSVSASLHTNFLYQQPILYDVDYFSNISFTMVVLSLGSLQTQTKSLVSRCVDVILHILFLWALVFQLYSLHC